MMIVERRLTLIIFIVFISAVCCGGDFIDLVVNNLNIKIGNHGFELTQANNVQRQELIQRACERRGEGGASTNNPIEELNRIPAEQLQHLLIDEKHKFLYCYVPKVSKIMSKLKVLLVLIEVIANSIRPAHV